MIFGIMCCEFWFDLKKKIDINNFINSFIWWLVFNKGVTHFQSGIHSQPRSHALVVLLNLGITFFHNFNLILRSFLFFLKMKHFFSCVCDLNIFFLKFLFLESLLFLWDINLDIFTVYFIIFIKKAKLFLIFRQDISVFFFFSTEYLYINYLWIR